MTAPITTASTSSSSVLPNTFDPPNPLQDQVIRLVNLPSYEISEQLEKSYYEFRENFDLLEQTGLELFKKGEVLPHDKYFYQHWGTLFLEKAASVLQNKGESIKALELRLKIAEKLIPYPFYPDINCQNPPQRPLMINTQYAGARTLKNGYFFYHEIDIDGKTVYQITFQLLLHAAKAVKKILNTLNDPEATKILIENGIGSSITLATTPYEYYTVEERTYKAKHANNIAVGTALTLTMDGLGTIQIGNQEKYGSMKTAVRIWFNQHPPFPLLAKVFAMMGLAEVMTPSFSKERIQKSMLIRFYDPEFAAKNDAAEWYHHLPLKELLNFIPEKTRNKINKHFYRLIDYKVGGEIRYKLPHLVDQAEELQGKGFMVKCAGEVNQVAARIASIFKWGLFSKQELYKRGQTSFKGISTLEDFEERSADGVFTTLLTASSLGRKYTEGFVSANYQIYVKLRACKKMPYCYSLDEYGTRKRTKTYETRPVWKKLVAGQQKKWSNKNEVIFKNHIPSKDLPPLITYQDPGRTVVLMLHGMDHLFKGCFTIKEKVDRLRDLYFKGGSGREALFRALEGRYFDPSTEVLIDPYDRTEQPIEKKLATHWLVDPYLALKDSFTKSGIDFNQFKVREQTAISSEVLDICHVPLAQKVRKLALKPHYVTHEKFPLRANAAQLIDEMRAYLETLSNESLFALVGAPKSSGILEVREWCSNYLHDIEYSGQGSLNLELLTQNELSFFSRPHRIIALFAAETIENRMKMKEELNTFEIINDSIVSENRISECLYYGLKDYHPVFLERLPTLQWKDKFVVKPFKYLRLYINRAKQRNFLYIIKAVENAYYILLNKMPEPYVRSSYADRPYNIDLWKTEYQDMFTKLLGIIEGKTEEELLSIYSDIYTPVLLKDQVLVGIDDLMTYGNKNFKNMTLQEIVDYITQSEALLNQEVCHYFYDRVHLLAALKSEKSPSIITRDGPVSLKTLMVAIIKSFANGVNLSNSIAAEQFYLRLLQLLYLTGDKN